MTIASTKPVIETARKLDSYALPHELPAYQTVATYFLCLTAWTISLGSFDH
jgi:hypothetical protein